jgi:ribonuclease D
LVGLTYPIGYAALVQDLLGQRMSKGETLTDWRRRPLSPGQVRYAFDDVRYLIPIWRKLLDRLKRLKRTAWADEEFQLLVRKSIGGDDTALERWRRLKGIGGLDRRGLAIARELYDWRNNFAERINRPARHLLRDDVLVELAKRAPTKMDDLSAYRGVPKAELTPILEAIKRAKGLSPEECPEPETRDNDPPPVVMLGNLLGVILGDWCSRNKLAPSLVASGSDLKAVVRSRLSGAEPANTPLMRGWRSAAILDVLLSFLDGTTVLRVSKPGSPSPVELVPLPVPQDLLSDELPAASPG